MLPFLFHRHARALREAWGFGDEDTYIEDERLPRGYQRMTCRDGWRSCRTRGARGFSEGAWLSCSRRLPRLPFPKRTLAPQACGSSLLLFLSSLNVDLRNLILTDSINGKPMLKLQGKEIYIHFNCILLALEICT